MQKDDASCYSCLPSATDCAGFCLTLSETAQTLYAGLVGKKSSPRMTLCDNDPVTVTPGPRKPHPQPVQAPRRLPASQLALMSVSAPAITCAISAFSLNYIFCFQNKYLSIDASVLHRKQRIKKLHNCHEVFYGDGKLWFVRKAYRDPFLAVVGCGAMRG